MDTRHEWEKKAAATRAKIEKLANEKVFKKQHLTFISNRIYPGFNDFLFMLQYEHKIIIDDSIIGIRILKTGSKVTHTLIVESLNKIKVEIEKIEPYPDIQGIVIHINGGDIIEF